MEKVYLVFTYHKNSENETLSTSVFANKESAIKMVDDYSDGQVYIEKPEAEIVDEFGDFAHTSYVPQEIYAKFWPSGNVIYGKTVKGIFREIPYNTYRFVVEKEIEKIV